ncbi:hypothetical protein V8B55DRAFT_1411947 [Mucor lusitanicus]
MANKIEQRSHLVIGDHSFPNMRYQEPVAGEGLKKQLRAHGFNVSLINEYLTSQICPACLSREARLKHFRMAKNQRPPAAGCPSYAPLNVRWGLLSPRINRCSNDD